MMLGTKSGCDQIFEARSCPDAASLMESTLQLPPPERRRRVISLGSKQAVCNYQQLEELASISQIQTSLGQVDNVDGDSLEVAQN